MCVKAAVPKNVCKVFVCRNDFVSKHQCVKDLCAKRTSCKGTRCDVGLDEVLHVLEQN